MGYFPVLDTFMKSTRSKGLIAFLSFLAFSALSLIVFTRFLGLWGGTRPPGVPTDAHLVSLIENGTWFQYSIDSSRDANKVKAWDLQGRLLADGYFRLEGENRAATNSELHPSIVQFRHDVNRTDYIYLFKRHGLMGGQDPFGKILVPIDDYTKRRLR